MERGELRVNANIFVNKVGFCLGTRTESSRYISSLGRIRVKVQGNNC